MNKIQKILDEGNLRFIVCIILLAISNIATIYKVNQLEQDNKYLITMINCVVEYADSTADTGEFDDFIQSEQGQKFFSSYKRLNNRLN